MAFCIGRLRASDFLWLILLLALPVLAVSGWPTAARWVGGYVLAIGAATWVLYGFDKRRAQTGRRRVPEKTLHLLELAGGWPAAYLARRYYRHKTAKGRYRVVFWTIVFLHQILALAIWRDGWGG